MWDRAKIDVEKCYEAHNKTQPFLGTAFVARDLISVVDALGEDGMLRYWGKQLTFRQNKSPKSIINSFQLQVSHTERP